MTEESNQSSLKSRSKGEDQGSTADRLYSTAAALFRQKGYANSTTRELSELLGIQKASLYYHISGKNELLREISLKGLERITIDVSAAAEAAAPEERLRAMIEAHLRSAIRDRDMHAVMLTELRALSPEDLATVMEKRDTYEHMIHEAIVEEQKSGRLRTDADPKYLRLALLNLLNWTIFWYEPDGDIRVDDLATLFATIFLEGTLEPGARP